MSEKKKILITAAECFPFSKAGGLADVIGTLPAHLVQLGYDVRVMVPYHRVTKDKFKNDIKHLLNFNISFGWRYKYVGVETLEKDGVTYYFIDNEDYFNDAMYLGGNAEGEQYMFFTKAVVESLPLIGFIPDVLLANDWHTAMIPMVLKTEYNKAPQGKIKTVYAIHNLMYQGKFPFAMLADMLCINSKYFTSEYLEFYGCANMLKAALVFSDKIVTVSPTYAKEIMFDYFSYGLSGVLRTRENDLVGIVNGIDVDEYDPESDKYIPNHYSISDLSGKHANKLALIKDLGLDISDDTPIISMVTRLTEQKGVDLIMPVFDEIMSENAAFVLLGSGDKKYEDFFKEMENRYPGKVKAIIGYNNEMAHKIYAGTDLFLMPSKFEPCGISQMLALRYGTAPIVRETGGLKDTVIPYNQFTLNGTGFSFANYNAHDMLNAIRFALSVYKEFPENFEKIVKQGMKCNNSFRASAEKYAEVFESIL